MCRARFFCPNTPLQSPLKRPDLFCLSCEENVEIVALKSRGEMRHFEKEQTIDSRDLLGNMGDLNLIYELKLRIVYFSLDIKLLNALFVEVGKF